MRFISFLMVAALVLAIFLTGCSGARNGDIQKTELTEQEVRDAVTELINGINEGDIEVVKKYVGAAGPVAEQLVAKLKDNIKISGIRDISIQGTSAQAEVTLEIIPLNIKKDVTLNFNATDVLLLDNPLGLLSLFIN